MNARLTKQFPGWVTVAISVVGLLGSFWAGARVTGKALGFKTVTPAEEIDRLAERLDQKNGVQDLMMGTFDARLAEQADTLNVFRADQQVQTEILCLVAAELRIDIRLSSIRRRCT